MPHGVVTRRGRSGYWLRYNAVARAPDGRVLRRSVLRKAQATTMPEAVREAARDRQRTEEELLEDLLGRNLGGRPTWGDAVDAYEADCRRRGTRLDRECYRLAIVRAGLGPDTPLHLVDGAQVLEWRARLQEERGLAPSSVNHYTTLVVSIVNHAVARGDLDASPLRRVRKIPEPRRQVEFLSEAQVAALLQATEAPRRPGKYGSVPIRLLIAIHYFTAARTSNVLELTWDQVDLEAATVTFPRTKNRRRVVAPIPPALVAILVELPSRTGYVLGQRWRNYRHAWKEAITRANVLLEKRKEPLIPSWARLYSLRHSRATHLARAGARAKAVADLLGDRLSMVEQRYYGVDLEGIREGLRIAADSASLAALEAGAATRLATSGWDAETHSSVSQCPPDPGEDPGNSSEVN